MIGHLIDAVLEKSTSSAVQQIDVGVVLWWLQKAVACTFYQFLDKSRTKSNWSQRLDGRDVRRSSLFNSHGNIIRAQMIQYATNDCLAGTKLYAVLEYEWTKRQLQEYNATCRQ